MNFCRRDFSLRETGFSPSFHEVALINYSLVSRARLFSLPLTRGPWNRRSRRRSRRPRQPFFFHEEEEESARGWARAVQTLNGQVFTEGRPGRVLSYRHRHLFSMPISVAHAPVGPTARNPQRRGERKRERARERGRKVKVKGRAGGRPFRERAATSALWSNPSLCSSAITTNYGCERWLRAHIGAKPLVTGLSNPTSSLRHRCFAKGLSADPQPSKISPPRSDEFPPPGGMIHWTIETEKEEFGNLLNPKETGRICRK